MVGSVGGREAVRGSVGNGVVVGSGDGLMHRGREGSVDARTRPSRTASSGPSPTFTCTLMTLAFFLVALRCRRDLVGRFAAFLERRDDEFLGIAIARLSFLLTTHEPA